MLTFKLYAVADVGIEQELDGMVKFRVAFPASMGPPKGPVHYGYPLLGRVLLG